MQLANAPPPPLRRVSALLSHLSPAAASPAPASFADALALVADNVAKFDIQYRPSLNSNHLSQHLLTLYQLGASRERLGKAFGVHAKKLDPRPTEEPAVHVQLESLPALLGKREHFAPLAAFFRSEIARLGGIGPAVALHYPKLSSGCAGAAFHAVILLGFGCEFSDPATAADGLAYLAYAHANLGKVPRLDWPPAPVRDSLLSLARAVDADPKPLTPARPEFMPKVASLHAAHDDKIARAAASFLPPGTEASLPARIRELQLCAASLFATPGAQERLDFFLLHGMTSLHALRRVMQHLRAEDRAEVARDYFRGFCCLFLAQRPAGFPTPEELASRDPGPDVWRNALQVALETDDEHVAKGIRTLLAWEQDGEGDAELGGVCRAAAGVVVRVYAWVVEQGAYNINVPTFAGSVEGRAIEEPHIRVKSAGDRKTGS
ncbi:hypothetical protein DFJ74DRAFT_704440 [Hyaloraphidium curvatum]|nr:hypothetical protein DFJ74DRAFT_704440 [Hyaloraphidium curvatum]